MIRKAIKLVKGKIVTKPLKNDGSKIDYLVSAMKDMNLDMRDIKTDIKGIKVVLGEVQRRGDATFEEVGNMKVELVGIHEEIGGIKKEVGNIKVEISEIKLELKDINARLDKIESRLDSVESDVIAIRRDIDQIKITLTQKSDIEYVKKLEKRVERIEAHFKLSVA